MKGRFFCGVAAVVAFVIQGGICRAEGNVAGLLFDGTLYIVGDKGDHDLTITGDADSGELLIEGDLIESYPLAALDALVILTGGGNDLLQVQGTIPGDLWISSGAGSDVLYLYFVTALGNVSIESGRGEDHIVIAENSVSGSLDITTNEGDDIVDFSLASVSSIGGNLHLSTGVGRDTAYVGSHLAVGGNLLLEMGQNDDYLSFLKGGPYGYLITVGGSAGLHGDQGNFDVVLSSYSSLEATIDAVGGLEVDGFE